MTISDTTSRNFLTALFHGNEIVSVQLPTSVPDMENTYAAITTLVITSPFTKGEAEEEQLYKILSACKLQQEKFSICTNDCSWAAIRKYENIRSVLLFGISERQLGITGIFAENQVVQFDDRQWVKTFPLGRLIMDAAAKNMLWQQALKPLFFQVS